MKTQKEIEDAEIKRTLMALAKEHKERCMGDCYLSLITVRVVLSRLGISLTEEEAKILI